jgi:hypothetical protein
VSPGAILAALKVGEGLPVTAMAMMPIALATGPVMDSCTVCSGVSQGMAVPLVVPAKAGKASDRATKAPKGAAWIRAARPRMERNLRRVIGTSPAKPATSGLRKKAPDHPPGQAVF